MSRTERHLEMQCIHGNSDFSYQEETRAVSFPIYQTATFGHIGLGHSSGFDYTREKNPTRQHLEETVSALEGAADTVAFASGMAAVSACFDLFQPGDHIICSEDLYGGVTRLFQTIGRKTACRSAMQTQRIWTPCVRWCVRRPGPCILRPPAIP